MVDTTLENIAVLLKAELPWLNEAYGRAFTLIHPVDRFEYPAVHLAGTEYLNVLPDDIVGNTSFFKVEDPQKVIDFGTGHKLNFRAHLIFWFNIETIVGGSFTLQSLEVVKRDILKALHRIRFIDILNVYEQAENIFKGYSIKQIDTQYLMLPYYGYRISMDIYTNKVC